MVPVVDKKDTEQLLNSIREQIESTRQEIKSWNLSAEHPTDEGEAQATRKLAERSAQQARQWTGRMLKELDTVYPYPNSSDSSTDFIDKTSVPQVAGYNLPVDFPVVRRIKHVRMNLAVVKVNLDELLGQCIPGSFFNQCLFRVQENTIQTGMWLGELLNEFYEAQPKVEAVAPGELTGSTSTTSVDSTKAATTGPAPATLSTSVFDEPAFHEVEGASEKLTAAPKAKTSVKPVRK